MAFRQTGKHYTVKFDATGQTTFSTGFTGGRNARGLGTDVENIDTTGAADTIQNNAPGIRVSEEVSIDFYFSKAELTEMLSIQGLQKNFQFALSDGSKWQGEGYVKRVGTAIDYRGGVIVTVTFMPETEFAYTAA